MRPALLYWRAYLWARWHKVGPATSRRYAQHNQALGVPPGIVSYTLWEIQESRRISQCYLRILP